MKEIEQNQQAWGKVAARHYEHFKERLASPSFGLNPLVSRELGDVSGKRILHLQCNTGADTILLARKGATVTGVDFVPENTHYARLLAEDFGVPGVQFVTADVLRLMDVHEGKYDIVLTTDGVLGWLPDLRQWGKTIEHFLEDEGFFYLHDSHPFMLIFDEADLAKGDLSPKYPYFKQEADMDLSIGGYASDSVEAENYFWGHQLSTIVDGLLQSGLYVSYLKEYDRCAPGMGGTAIDAEGLSYYPELEGKLPLVMSLKARKLRQG